MKRWALVIIVIVAVVGLVGWRMVQKQTVAKSLAAGAKDRSNGAVSVSAAIAGPSLIKKTLEAVGTVTAPYNVKISPKVSGLIDYLQVRQGDRVTAGQVIVRLDPDTSTATVLQNKANVAQARQRYYQAQLTQRPTDVGVQTAIQQQRAAVDTAVANLNQVVQNYNARVAAARASVTDGNAKIGQARATLASAGANLTSARATLSNAQSKLNRDLDLYKQNYIAAQDVDDQKTAVSVAAAGVDVAQKGVDGAKQAVDSAIALRNASQNQLDITQKQAQADISVAKAAEHSANQALKLANANTAQAPAYKANLDALQAAVDASEGTLKASEVLANDVNLASPIDGTVTSRTLDPGSIAQPGTPILTVEFLKWVYFSASIPVEQSAEVALGQDATVTLDALPGRTFHGTISQLNPSADPTSHQFMVLIKLENPNELLRPGMYGHISVVVSSQEVPISVPREAVITNPDGSHSVTLIDSSDTAHTVPVQLGAEDAIGYQVVSGLNAGDKVVSLTYNPIKDGHKVKVDAISTPEGDGFGVDKLLPPPKAGASGGSRKAGAGH